MVDYVEMSLLQYYMSSIFNCVNLIWSGPNLMKFSYVTELPTAGTNLNHRVQAEDLEMI